MSSVVGVVLAGGASRRFGRDKAELHIRGETLAQRAAGLLRGACREVLVADRGRGLVAGAVSIADGRGAGPAAGLLGAASARPGRRLLALACDLPAVPPSLLVALLELGEQAGDASWVPRHPPASRGEAEQLYSEPLCALYRAEDLSVLETRVREGKLALQGWLKDPGTSIRYLEGDDLLRHGAPEEVFVNLNRPRDLVRWLDGRSPRSAADGEEDVGL